MDQVFLERPVQTVTIGPEILHAPNLDYLIMISVHA